MLPTLLVSYLKMLQDLKQHGMNTSELPYIAGYHEAKPKDNDNVIREYMTRRRSRTFGDNKPLAKFLETHTPADIFGRNRTKDELPFETQQYFKVCRCIGARRRGGSTEKIMTLFTSNQISQLYSLVYSGRMSVNGLIFLSSHTHVPSNGEPWTAHEMNRMNLLSLASALFIHDVSLPVTSERKIASKMEPQIDLIKVWEAVIDTVEQQSMNIELLSESKKPLGGLCSLVYKPHFNVPFSDAAGMCDDHKIKCNGHSMQTQSKEVCTCAGFYGKCKYRQDGQTCPSIGNICRWSKLHYAATKLKLLDVVSILHQAHDKMCTAVYIYLYLHEEFKQGLIRLEFYSEVIYLDAIGDIWSAFSLPELRKFERLARALKGMVFFHAIIGEQLYTPEVSKKGVLRDTDMWLGISMNNIWESFTNVSAFIVMHIGDDGQKWTRLSSVSKMFSNDLVEEYHSLVTGVNGNYKSLTPDFDAVAKSVDTMAVIRMSPERRHLTWVSNKKNYQPITVSARAQALYNESDNNEIYSNVVDGIYYMAVKKRALREIRGKYQTIRGHYKLYGSSMDPAVGVGLSLSSGAL